MIRPGDILEQLFTCLDTTGANAAPTGTPTGVFIKNGDDIPGGTVAVTITMSGSQGIARATIPGGYVAGDRVAIKVAATVSGVTQTIPGPVYYLDPATVPAVAGDAMALTSGERVSTAAAVRTELTTELACLDTTISSRLATSGYTAPPSVSGLATSVALAQLGVDLSADIDAVPTVAEIAAGLLANPANKLATNSNGYVTSTNGGGGSCNSTTFVMPLQSTSAERVLPNRIDLFVRERVQLTISIFDDQRLPVDCNGLECTLFVAGGIEIPGLTPTSSMSSTVLNQYVFTPPEQLTAAAGSRWFGLRVSDNTERVLAFGHLVVAEVP